jgi:hypothetical protein
MGDRWNRFEEVWLSKSKSSFSSHKGTRLGGILTGTGMGPLLLLFLSPLGNLLELDLLDDADADVEA